MPRSASYDRWVARTATILDALAWVFLVDFVLLRFGPDGPPWWQPSLTAVSVAIWLAYAVDYVVRCLLSDDRKAFIVSHKLDLLMVTLPMLRIVRVFVLLARSFSRISTEQIAGSLLTLVVLVVLVGAFLEWVVERDAPGATITTPGLALWWAIVTTTTVGYGDTYPVTVVGRMIGSVIMVVGIGLIGTVSATVAAWFVKRNQSRRERTRDDTRPADGSAPEPADGGAGTDPATQAMATGIAELTARIEELAKQQQQLHATIERLADRPTA